MTNLLRFFLLLFFFFSLPINAQNVANETETQPEEIKTFEEYTEDDFELIKSERLKRIRRELVRLRSDIYVIRKSLNDDTDMVMRIQQEAKINQLEQEYEKKKNLFIETITSINLAEDIQRKKKTTFSEDIKHILDPALSTFKKISEKPRQIQTLNEEIDYLSQRYKEAQKASVKLKEFQKKNENKNLNRKVREAIKSTDGLVDSLKVKLEDLQFQLLKIEENQESIVTTFSSIIFEFIKTKGKNLLLALIVFLSLFWMFKLGQSKFIDIVLFRVSRSDNGEVYNWIIRPTKVMYNVITTLIAFFMCILTLYVLNDWVLVTLILIMFAALVWSSKQYIPLFLEQSKVILNLGSVREGERVIYHGLPWRIDSLGYYCKLTNPDLSGAYLRVNTKELINSHSRRCIKGEPWFPTDQGDWIMYGEKLAQVKLQTPEQVIITLIGGETISIPTVAFFELSPKNLSLGFSVEIEFGLDYGIQNDIFSEVLPNFESRIKREVAQTLPELQGKIEKLTLEFLRANSSSLDLRLFLKLDGSVAHLKLYIERVLQKELVKTCNEFGYSIPFNQLTVHMPHEQRS